MLAFVKRHLEVLLLVLERRAVQAPVGTAPLDSSQLTEYSQILLPLKDSYVSLVPYLRGTRLVIITRNFGTHTFLREYCDDHFRDRVRKYW